MAGVCVTETLFRPKAKSDIDDIWNYTFDTWNIDQADQYIKNLIETCISLAENPRIGISRNELYEGLHMQPSGKHLIFYLIIDDGIDIVRILHECMDSNLQQFLD